MSQPFFPSWGYIFGRQVLTEASSLLLDEISGCRLAATACPGSEAPDYLGSYNVGPPNVYPLVICYIAMKMAIYSGFTH